MNGAKFFKPALIDADGAPGIKTRFYYMPGGHSTGVLRLKTEVALIAAFLIHRFLTRHGTQLENPIALSARDLCELYAKIRIDMAHYHSMGGGVLQVLGRQRRTVQNLFQDTDYFINDHHAHQFRKTFPHIWSALAHGVQASARPGFMDTVRVLKGCAPTTYFSLQNAGLIS